MAAFPKMTLTNVGQALQTKVLAGAELTFTRIALGDGKLNGQPISPLTALIHQTASVPVDTVVVINDDTCQASGFFSNTDISTGFWWRETGIFAQDPDVGEILYGYTNAGDAGDYIPPVQDTRIEKYIFCSIAVANAETVNITIPSSDTFIPLSQKGAPGGVATLDSTGKVPKEQLPEMDAASVAYDNGSSGLVASTVQGALDELVTGLNEGTIAQADATLTSTGWTGDTPTQTLSVPGLPSNSPAWIGLAVTATAAQRDAARKAALSPTARAAGSVTITADGAQPTTDLPVTVYYIKKAPEGGAELLASIINMFPGGSTLQIPLDAPTALIATAGNAQVSLTWTDPKDKYATPEGEIAQDPDQLVSKWAYTRIVRKVGSQPSGPNDGTTVLESAVRNQYQTEPFVDPGLQNEVTYYYGAFAYNEDGVVSEGALASITLYGFDSLLENNTWDQIELAAGNGLAPSIWEIGDTKSGMLLGDNMIYAIAGFNLDDLTDGSGKAPITFTTKNTMSESKAYGTSTLSHYTTSTMFQYLRDSVYPAIPSDLKSIIKKVTKKAKISASNTTETFDAYLFNPAVGEVGGSSIDSDFTYPYYATAANRVKTIPSAATSNQWMLRTGASKNSYGDNEVYGVIASNGQISSGYNYRSYGVCFNFCI